MDAEKLEGLIIDYIDGKLTAAERLDVERELAVNSTARKLFDQFSEVMNVMGHSAELQPAPRMQENFEKMLQKEMTGPAKKGANQVFFTPAVLRMAAAVALLISGVAIGYYVNKYQEHEEQLAEIQKEVAETKRLMMSMLDNRESASQRMMGATVAFNQMERADDQVVVALTKAMNEDPNTNVRLAALEALGKFNHQEHVRRALIASLSTQKDPIIQIALIRMMVEIKEKQAVKELKKITDDVLTLPAVKDEAHYGILKLS